MIKWKVLTEKFCLHEYATLKSHGYYARTANTISKMKDKNRNGISPDHPYGLTPDRWQ